MLMLIIFANIISRPIGDRLIKSKGGRFGFFFFKYVLIQNQGPRVYDQKLDFIPRLFHHIFPFFSHIYKYWL